MKTTDNKKNEGLIDRIKKPYERSIRRRINFDYVRSYVIIGLVMLCVFLVAYWYYYCGNLSKNTPLIAEEIRSSYASNNGVIDRRLKSTLDSIVNVGQAQVISLYDGEGQLLITTSHMLSLKLTTGAKRTLLSDVTSLFSSAVGGLYKDEAVLSDVNLRVVIGYSLSGIKSDYVFLAYALLLTIVLGAIIFTFAGYARIQKLLKPIDDMTSVVKNINSDNLSLRLDEDKASYELKELASTVNKMIDRLEDSYERQKHFVSDVSHELRTPISVISGYASMLKRWGAEDKEVLNESIEAIINETANMQNLVEALLFLTRHDNHSLKYEFAEFDLSELIEDIVRDTLLIHDDFFIDTNVEEALVIYADCARIKQLIRILLENAIKYSGESKRVSVSAHKNQSGTFICVKDFGIGIEKKDIRKIFDRFYRADESRTKQISGYGLGLAMATAIIRGHGGKITVKSKLGNGSEFTAFIPVKKQKRVPAAEAVVLNSAKEEITLEKKPS